MLDRRPDCMVQPAWLALGNCPAPEMDVSELETKWRRKVEQLTSEIPQKSAVPTLKYSLATARITLTAGMQKPGSGTLPKSPGDESSTAGLFQRVGGLRGYQGVS